MSRKIGTRVADAFRKVGDGVLSLGRLPSKVARRPRRRRPPKRMRIERKEVPARLRGFFERRHAGWPDYVMLKAQIAIIVLFAVSVTYAVLSLAEVVFFTLICAFSAYALYLVPTQLKRAFARDYPAYRAFVAMCVGIAWAFVLILKYMPAEPTLDSPHATIVPMLLAVCLAFFAFITFRLKYGRSYTYGIVESAKGTRIMVRIGYDLRSNIRPDIYLVRSLVRLKKGDKVKVGVERPTLGLRGAKVKTVLEKIS